MQDLADALIRAPAQRRAHAAVAAFSGIHRCEVAIGHRRQAVEQLAIATIDAYIFVLRSVGHARIAMLDGVAWRVLIALMVARHDGLLVLHERDEANAAVGCAV